jgi:hypothetical protein
MISMTNQNKLQFKQQLLAATIIIWLIFILFYFAMNRPLSVILIFASIYALVCAYLYWSYLEQGRMSNLRYLTTAGFFFVVSGTVLLLVIIEYLGSFSTMIMSEPISKISYTKNSGTFFVAAALIIFIASSSSLWSYYKNYKKNIQNQK